VAGYVDTFGASRIKDLIGSTTRDDLAESLAEGYGAGETTLQIVKRIMAVFLQADRHRAQMIAETEITIASGVAAQAGMEMAGVEYKQWLATLDSHTRDTHREMNGQIKAVNEDFESPSGATGAGPGQFEDPAEDIFCRCAAIPIPVEALDQARADAAADQAATVKKTVKRKGHLRRLYAGEVAARQPHVDRMLEAVREGFQRQRDYVIVQLRR
jgi:SPP1 gp7 family putative phage head morphogenesis protein